MTWLFTFIAGCYLVGAVLWFGSGVWPAMGVLDALLAAAFLIAAVKS